MRIRGWALVIVGAVVAGLLEATFLTLLPSPWRDIHPVIDGAVLFVILNRSKAGMVFGAVAGFLLDLFSVGPASFASARLLVVAAVISLLSITLLTNRSMYATAVLVVIARIVDRFWVWMFSLAAGVLFHAPIPMISFGSFAITLLWDVGIVSACFIVLAFFTRRFLITAPSMRPYDDA
jgi:cell shape-determining protein MreD